ncbi:MAG: S8 family serine peptidase [candidate division Zixibacteria bacterium]|nr:S8 family serine peptidase [candidate division Zixibacteria bacterium]
MKYKTLLLVCFVFLFSALFVNPLRASKIHPALKQQIAQSQNEYQKVVIRLDDRLDKQSLNQKLSLASYTRQAAHAKAVTALKSHAVRTQSDILQFLEKEQANGNVLAFKSYWIDNLIWASVRSDFLKELEQFDEIDLIYPEIKVSVIEPITQASPVSPGQVGVTEELEAIGADSAWKLGYTGEGTLVATFDTGVEGDHPALTENYRGTNGYSYEQCWFDPIDNDTFPHIFDQVGQTQRRAHGTATIGIIVGKDDVSGDTVGVAFGAQWISAGVIDIPNDQPNQQYYLLDAFQWAADPDGDPNTISDVPDVLSNSWGYPNTGLGCSDLFYGVIDNLEALGVVVMFSSGNFGSNYRTLANPANRATTAYNSFAVGMISSSYDDITVDFTSSRGPSNCNLEIIKPNVVAPGRGVTTIAPEELYPGGIVTNFTGTSFSCPYAAGAALILRQANPNAPVDSIKKALMLSATDIDEPGPDSAAGYGLINIPAALEMLTSVSEPNIELQSLTSPSIIPGQQVEFYVTIQNTGLGTTGITGTLRSSNSSILVNDSVADFGDIAQNASANNISDEFEISVSSLLGEGRYPLELFITDGNSYSKALNVFIEVGENQQEQTFTIDIGAFAFTVSNHGIYGLGPGSFSNLGGVGFVFPVGQGEISSLYEMGLMVGTDPDHISDAINNIAHLFDRDFVVASGGNFEVTAPSEGPAQKTRSVFTDTNAVNPLGIKITQETYAYDTEIDDHFMIFVYALENISDSTIENIYTSLYTDWDLYTPQGGLVDMTAFDRQNSIGYMYEYLGDDYRGVAVLNDEGIKSFRSINRENYYGTTGFSNQEKWDFMSQGFVDTASTEFGDYSSLTTTGPFTLAPGEVDTAAFAIIASDNEADLLTLYAPQANTEYTDSLPRDVVPPGFTVDLFLNPVLPFELDIYSHPSEDLLIPPEVRITSPSNIELLSMEELAGHDLATYVGDYRITESGSYSLSVCGKDLSHNDSCEIMDFTAGIILPAKKAVVGSFAGTYEIEIPSGAVSREGLLLLEENEIEKVVSQTLNIGPDFEALKVLNMSSGFKLVNGMAKIEIDLDRIDLHGYSKESLVLISTENGTKLPLEINPVDNSVNGHIADFGEYVLAVQKTSSPGQLPTAYELHQNVPNPFNPRTRISFSLPENSHVNIEIFNILGQRVTTLADDNYPAGNHDVIWESRNSNGENVSTGIYFYRLTTERFTQTKRMLLLK